jgi:hypothetical protein
VRRLASVLVLAGLAALLASAPATGWRYTFQDFFDAQGGAVAAAVAKAKKCSGGKLGTYDYASRVVSSGGDTELEVEVLAELSVREKFKRMKHVEVSASGSNIDRSIVDQAATALQEYHESVFTRWKPGKLKIRHGALVMFGNEVVAPGVSTTKFKPKPGC